jgi:hypothetical protein
MSEVNKGFLIALSLVIGTGMVQYGYVMASWNALQEPFEVRYGHSKADATWWSVAITTAGNLGATVSALGAGWLIKFGKW